MSRRCRRKGHVRLAYTAIDTQGRAHVWPSTHRDGHMYGSRHCITIVSLSTYHTREWLRSLLPVLHPGREECRYLSSDHPSWRYSWMVLLRRMRSNPSEQELLIRGRIEASKCVKERSHSVFLRADIRRTNSVSRTDERSKNCSEILEIKKLRTWQNNLCNQHGSCVKWQV